MMRRTPMPRRRTKPRRKDPLRVPQHRAWVRGHYCLVPGCKDGPIEASHINVDIPAAEKGGVGQKAHDKWTTPKCSGHHREYHQKGHDTFEKKYNVRLKDIAVGLWQTSPHRHKYEREQRELVA